jgi:hypothetical protein
MSLAISRTVFHDQTAHFVNGIRISACWRPTGTLVTANWSSAIFKPIIPFFNLCNPHGVVAESLLNLTNCFTLGTTKPLAKLDAVALFSAFRHCARSKNATSTCYTSTHTGCRAATGSLYKVTKNHTCALGTTAAPCWVLPLASNYFPRKKSKVGYILNRPRI